MEIIAWQELEYSRDIQVELLSETAHRSILCCPEDYLVQPAQLRSPFHPSPSQAHTEKMSGFKVHQLFKSMEVCFMWK